MASLKLKFYPERKKIDGEIVTSNVRILTDVFCATRLRSATTLRLFDIDDFDKVGQKIKPGKKVKNGSFVISAAIGNDMLNIYRNKFYSAYTELMAARGYFTAQDVYAKAFPKPKKIEIVKKQASYDYINEKIKLWYTNKVFGETRYYKYQQLGRMVERYCKLIRPFDFHLATEKDMMDLAEFIKNEHIYYQDKKNADLFPERRPPLQAKSSNTVAIFMKLLGGFFREIKAPNPLKESSKTLNKITREQYNEPIFLTIDELLHCVAAEYPERYKLERDSFLLQCALGLRVQDYYKLSKTTPIKHPAGFYYARYAPSKTNVHSKELEIIEVPLVKFAYDILEQYNFQMPFGRYAAGKITTKYNAAIKELLKGWGINREVMERDAEGVRNVPLYELASNKLARKTFVDIIAKSQINPYLSGLHKQGSDAVKHYTHMGLEDRWKFFSMAFRQELY